jgi:hypothetical protein
MPGFDNPPSFIFGGLSTAVHIYDQVALTAAEEIGEYE